MLINIIGCTGQSPRSKNEPTPKVHSAKAEEPCSMQSQSIQELAAFSLPPPPPPPRILPPLGLLWPERAKPYKGLN